ncbi:GntR family transcriptional regulator [Hoeflea sp.]|uniref:GntR family transcriptional regulator n=1 Tax=Hoeflea sp. TaxID=1940281 RepID=UPI003B023528
MTASPIEIRRPGRPAFDLTGTPEGQAFSDACQSIILDKASTKPLWRQLYEQLEATIREGRLEPHARIPSEEMIADRFGISRPVVRNAMQALAGKGLVVKIHRKGIFVGSPPLETDFISTTLSAYDDLIARGHAVRTKTLEFYRCEPDAKEREALGLDADGSVVRVVRVFWMDDAPITYTRMSLHGEKVPGFENMDVRDRSILGMVRERYGRTLVRAERWLNAVIPPEKVAVVMGIKQGLPMIEIESVAFESDNTPMEYYRAYYNSDAARIHMAIMK